MITLPQQPSVDFNTFHWEDMKAYLQYLLDKEREKNDNTRASLKSVFVTKGRISVLKELISLDVASDRTRSINLQNSFTE